MRYSLICLFFLSTCLMAGPIDGKKRIFLESSNGELIYIADINFETIHGQTSYKISLKEEPFTDQFLSMRPFQCIMGERQVMCHVPYPYPKEGNITETDLSELSYDLLFLHKSPSEYGINLWNGLFYKLAVKDNSIVGAVFEVDMNIIASPPDNKDAPFAEDEIFEADVANYLYPRILIQE